MERPDHDIHDDAQEIDLQSLKRAMMRRDEAVERFRAAKAQLLNGRPSQDVRQQNQPPDQH